MAETGVDRTVVVLSGPPISLEYELNLYARTHVVTGMNFAVVGDSVILTIVMIHKAEVERAMRMAAIANAAVPGAFRPS